ncbi:MAG: type 1 glutamine amidotransferase [Candidatus Omnitrophica bacterium]|nr:type 1 glutamine amidotransferase [Candidatus Omnitrophota bacterium]
MGEILILKHIGIEGPGTLGDFLAQSSFRVRTIELGEGEDLPENTEGLLALVLLGGPMNVYEDERYPFLNKEESFLKEALRCSIPILGICLGAQVLAKACGATIRKNPVKEIGWYPVGLSEHGRGDALFGGLPETLNVFQWHYDTFDIPAGACRLAEGAACRNQAFRFGANAYGLQFHIEVTPQMIGSWIDSYQQESGVRETNDMLIEAYRRHAAYEAQAQKLYLNFARIIDASRVLVVR